MTNGVEIPYFNQQDAIDGQVRESVDRPGTRPQDLERFDLRSLAQTYLQLEARAPEASVTETNSGSGALATEGLREPFGYLRPIKSLREQDAKLFVRALGVDASKLARDELT